MPLHNGKARFLNDAFLKFQKPGSPCLAAAINEYLQSYVARIWDYNSPHLLDRVASTHRQRICPDLEDADESPIVESPKSLTVVTKDTRKRCWMQPLPSKPIQPRSIFTAATLLLHARPEPGGCHRIKH
jgi:hypothetical protein